MFIAGVDTVHPRPAHNYLGCIHSNTLGVALDSSIAGA